MQMQARPARFVSTSRNPLPSAAAHTLLQRQYGVQPILVGHTRRATSPSRHVNLEDGDRICIIVDLRAAFAHFPHIVYNSMSTPSQTSLEQALDFPPPSSAESSIHLSDDICFGNSAVGGYIAAVLQKNALLYASRHPALSEQVDVRLATTTFYRPVFPSKGSYKIKFHEVSIGKAWSFLRVEILEGTDGGKICASAEINLTNFAIPGITLDTHWKLTPPPTKVDLVALDSDSNSVEGWTSYHTPFYTNGFRRGHAYVKYYFPNTTYKASQSYVEHWIQPGWDCTPLGSRDHTLPEARWTNETLPFVADMNMPVQENYHPHDSSPKPPFPMGSVAATAQFAAVQRIALKNGNPNWRDLSFSQQDDNNNDKRLRLLKSDGSTPDGFKAFMARKNTLNTTLNMSVEFKKRLPPGGVRWLYLRGEVKTVQNGRADWQVLCFDQGMELVFVRNGVEIIVDPASKNVKVKSSANLKGEEKKTAKASL